MRAEAQRQEVTATFLVLQWIEAGLDGDLGRSSPPPSSDLEARLDALEQRLDALPAAPVRSPTAQLCAVEDLRPTPKPAGPTVPIGTVGAASGAITTAELAQRTGTNRAAWNTWASNAKTGDVRRHAAAGNWRLVGKAPAEVGGPARWLWELA